MTVVIILVDDVRLLRQFWLANIALRWANLQMRLVGILPMILDGGCIYISKVDFWYHFVKSFNNLQEWVTYYKGWLILNSPSSRQNLLSRNDNPLIGSDPQSPCADQRIQNGILLTSFEYSGRGNARLPRRTSLNIGWVVQMSAAADTPPRRLTVIRFRWYLYIIINY